VPQRICGTTLDLESSKSIACAIISSRLDYANSSGISSYNIHRLQRVQNCLARVLKPTDSATMSRSLLASLHWLPIRQRVTFKLAGLVYRRLHETSPTYLSSVLHAYTPTRSLRSSSAHFLVEPRLRTTLASRDFWSAGPRIWNCTKSHKTCSLFLLVQIQTQILPLYFSSLITGRLVNSRASDSTSYSILRALQMFYITLHYWIYHFIPSVREAMDRLEQAQGHHCSRGTGHQDLSGDQRLASADTELEKWRQRHYQRWSHQDWGKQLLCCVTVYTTICSIVSSLLSPVLYENATLVLL